MTRHRLLFSLLLLLLPLPLVASENWPAFRGPTGLGYTDETDLPISWGGPDNKNVLWKSPLLIQAQPGSSLRFIGLV